MEHCPIRNAICISKCSWWDNKRMGCSFRLISQDLRAIGNLLVEIVKSLQNTRAGKGKRLKCS